jgi:hypothetical protein
MPSRITHPVAPPFRRSLALVVGVDAYAQGIPPLHSAVADAEAMAAVLRDRHGFEVLLRSDAAASRAALENLLARELSAALGPDDRLLLYFAGHGLAADTDDGPTGYLLPQDARANAPASWLGMLEVQRALEALPVRHLLLILDCCFAGAFRWASTRAAPLPSGRIYHERFTRFARDPAWQVIASAADDQRALDTLATLGSRPDDGGHSPFAQALLDALDTLAPRSSPQGRQGAPDGDGVLTATELYLLVRDRVELATLAHSSRQTPALWPLARHGKGEFLFWDTSRALELEEAPPLDEARNPYRGLQPFEREHRELFFGRAQLVAQLAETVAHQPLTVVVGPSGSGKSSLVRAGLLPALADQPGRFGIFDPIRPGAAPLRVLDALPPDAASASVSQAAPPPLAGRVSAWLQRHPGQILVLTIDQCEELITLCADEAERALFLAQLAEALVLNPERLRLVLTLRSDFEPQFTVGSLLAPRWEAARFVVTPLSQDELRRAIVGPATARVLTFETDDLVEQIVNEVVLAPGALPLLSFALSELYLRYLERQRQGASDRTLREEDYRAIGGVAGALRSRVEAEYQRLDPDTQATMRRVMLRMVAVEAGELARQRVPRADLEFADAAENARVGEVLRRLEAARLVVAGRDDAGEPYVEPAHDALVGAWDRLWVWVQQAQEALLIQRRLSAAARDWRASGRLRALLWDDDPRLRQAEFLAPRPPTVLELYWEDLTRCTVRPKDWLNKLEREFLFASVRKRSRVRQRGAILITVTLVVFALLSLLSVIYGRQAAIARDAAYAFAAQAALARDEARRIALDLERRQDFCLVWAPGWGPP